MPVVSKLKKLCKGFKFIPTKNSQKFKSRSIAIKKTCRIFSISQRNHYSTSKLNKNIYQHNYRLFNAATNFKTDDQTSMNVHVDLDIPQRSTISFFAGDEPGCLSKCLQVISECGINLTRIESRYVQDHKTVKFRVDMEEPYNSKKIRNVVKSLTPLTSEINLQKPRKVPWFPVTMEQMDKLALLVLEPEGAFEQTDVPQFKDKEYLKRRAAITKAADDYVFPELPKRVNYSKEEVECWGVIWKALYPLLQKHACDEYWEVGEALFKECNYTENNLPQLCDINEFISKRTGFRLRPTAGLLSSRHFLNGLAFKTFFCTQYIRHPSMPFYTPEPDVVHELVGHAPMFCDPEFAKFSQEIGLASIGATDEQIDHLARCYWYSVEFGICKSKKNPKENKIYGAGILSSVNEIKNAMLYAPNEETGEFPEIRKWNPFDAAQHPFPITNLQDIFYCAEDFKDATSQMSHFAEFLDKPFSVSWDNEHQELVVDGNIYRDEPTMEKGTYGQMGM